jgi:hypothetical protein
MNKRVPGEKFHLAVPYSGDLPASFSYAASRVGAVHIYDKYERDTFEYAGEFRTSPL